jgi:hypothetical protein
MTEPNEIDPEFLLAGVQTFGLLWPIVGNDLPHEVHSAIFAELERLGEPRTRSEPTRERVERLLLAREGLLAAYYHRDRIESTEKAVISQIRDAFAADLPPGATSSTRMPVLSHEFVAYLLAARRTLDYLARGVGACFNRPRVYKITKLASALADARPTEIASKAVAECADITARFPHLLRHEGRLSDRDRAAHYWPIEPAYLLIVNFPNGGIGIEFKDGGYNYLPTHNDLDLSRMSRDEPMLTAAIDKQLAELSAFSIRLISIAVDAELTLRVDESQ